MTAIGLLLDHEKTTCSPRSPPPRAIRKNRGPANRRGRNFRALAKTLGTGRRRAEGGAFHTQPSRIDGRRRDSASGMAPQGHCRLGTGGVALVVPLSLSPCLRFEIPFLGNSFSK